MTPFRPTSRAIRAPQRGRAAGFTLVELCITMTILCLMVVLAVPVFRSAIEQARADVATANLKTIWAAQRVYWLDNHRFASRLSDLRSLDLIDGPIADSASNGKAVYVYRISNADTSSFIVGALRNASGVWSGEIQINQEGRITGTVVNSRGGVIITPTQP
jgi:prepilin-type N-terminal cleavage/methylation domain-containing protein